MGLHSSAERLGRIQGLDRLARPAVTAVKRAVPPGWRKDLLSGSRLGHPLHPLLTDIPIGALTSATVLDLVGGRLVRHLRARPAGRRGLDSLVELAMSDRVVVMCAESVWWRCHRRLLADALVLLCDVAVRHLFHDGRLAPHPVTPAARRAGDQLLYDVGQTASLLPG